MNYRVKREDGKYVIFVVENYEDNKHRIIASCDTLEELWKIKSMISNMENENVRG